MVPQESKLFPIFQVLTEKRPCFLFTHQERINWALKGPGLSRFLGDTSYLSRFNKRNWRPLGFGKIPGTQTSISMSSIPFGRKALLLRSPDRNRKIGLGDALRETSRIKSFLSYAIYYSYVRDIRFYQFYMLFVLISLCWYWGNGIHCLQLHPGGTSLADGMCLSVEPISLSELCSRNCVVRPESSFPFDPLSIRSCWVVSMATMVGAIVLSMALCESISCY